MDSTEKSIEHWIALAAEAKATASYEDSLGLNTSHIHMAKAKLYQHAAESLRLTKSTGQYHCACCLSTKCRRLVMIQPGLGQGG